jgi:hypothetical protein
VVKQQRRAAVQRLHHRPGDALPHGLTARSRLTGRRCRHP